MIHDIRFLLWVAFLFFGVACTGAISWAIRRVWLRLCVVAIAWLALILGTTRLYTYVPKDAEMAMEETYRGASAIGLHAQLSPGTCHGGVAEITQKIQWTWFLNGSRFGCKSNEYESNATIDFEPGAYEEADTSVIPSTIPQTNSIRILISWYSPRNDGRAKWVISAACLHGLEIPIPYKDVLTALDSPGSDMGEISSGGDFTFDSPCVSPDGIFIRIARHGSDKDDTLTATAHLTRISVNQDSGSNNTFTVPH